MGLGQLLQQADPRAAGRRFSKRGEELAQRRAGAEARSLEIQRIKEEEKRKRRSNPFNQIVGAIGGFLTGGPLGAVAGAVTAPKGDDSAIQAALGGFGAGGAATSLGQLVTDPGKLAAGVVGPAQPKLDFGRLVSPENLETTFALGKGLAEGRPLEGLLSAHRLQSEKQARRLKAAKQAADDELARDLKRAQIDKLKAEREFKPEFIKGTNVIFDPNTKTVTTVDGAVVPEESLKTKDKASFGLSLKKDFDTGTKPVRIVNQFRNNIIDFADKTKAVTSVKIDGQTISEGEKHNVQNVRDIGMLYSFIKILDPESVVREGEIKLSDSAIGMLERLGINAEKVLTGEILSDRQRAGMISVANDSFKNAGINILGNYNKTARSIDVYGLDRGTIISPQDEAIIVDLSSISPISVSTPEEAEFYPSGTMVRFPDGRVGEVQ